MPSEELQSPAIIFLSPDFRILSWSAAAAGLYGYSTQDAIGLHISALGLSPSAVSRGGVLGVIEHRNQDGSIVAAELSCTWMEGEYTGVCVVARLPRSQCIAEHADNESDVQFRTLVQGVTDYAVFMLSPSGRVVTWNPGAQRIKGTGEKTLLGRISLAFTRLRMLHMAYPLKRLLRRPSKGGSRWKVGGCARMARASGRAS
nr:PAS domain-containing protein [Caballeronia pedi]